MARQTLEKTPVMGKEKPPRLPVLYGFIAAGVAVLAILLLVFPNLSGNAGFLALTVFTIILGFTGLGLIVSGASFRLPATLKWGFSVVLVAFLALDFIIFLLPVFTPGKTANDASPFAAATQPAMANGADAMAKPTTNAMVQPTGDAMMVKPTADAMAKPTVDAMAKPTTDAMAKPTVDAMAKPAEGAMMAQPTADAMAKPTAEAMAKPLTGIFNNEGLEPVVGNVIIGKSAEGKNILRFENFKTPNGPDLYVYLTKVESPSDDGQIKAGLEVTALKISNGNLNFDLPANVDLSQYKSVVVYCKSFSKVFGYANLK